MSKATKTFEQRRKALLARMSARSKKQPIKKVIPFRNDDVPNYLRELDKFEEKSRQANLVVSEFGLILGTGGDIFGDK
jgi:hypothetical protein